MTHHNIRPELPPLISRMKARPLDARGYPVPFFVAWVDGQPDHRIVDPAKLRACVEHSLCWLCGQALGRNVTYVVGPMCAINRVSSEPPSHDDCASWAVRACPFLTRPHAQRRETSDVDVALKDPAGVVVERNPGVSLLWTTRDRVKPFRADQGWLFRIGEPTRVAFYAEGRVARHDEIMAAIDTGYPLLLDMARADGPDAIALLEGMRIRALELVPA